jgi:hypothetical protein
MKVRIALYSLAIVFAILVIVIAGILTLDFGRFKANAETLLSDALQREFSIDGPLHLEIGRTIEFSAEGVRLASSDWADDPTLASIRRIDARIDTWSLINGPVRVSALNVDGLRVNLQENELGENNWTFGLSGETGKNEEESADRPGLPMLTDNVNLTDIVLIYDGPQLARPLRIVLDRINQKVLPSRHLELNADGIINDTPVDLKLTAGKIDSLATFSDVQIDVRGQVGEIRFDGNAAVADLLYPRRPTATMNLVGPNIEYLTDLLGMQRITTGPLRLEMTIAPVVDIMQLNLSGAFGEFTVAADGKFADLADMQSVDLRLSANGPDAGRVAALAGVKGVPSDPFSIVGSLHRSGAQLRIEDVNINVGDTRVAIKGYFDQFPKPEGANMAVHIEGPDVASLRDLIGVKGILSGPYGLDANLAPHAAGGASITLTGYVSDISVSMGGHLSNEPGLVGSTLMISYEIPDLATVAAAFDIRNSLEIALQGTAEIERVSGGFKIHKHEILSGSDRLVVLGVVTDSPLQPGSDVHIEATIADMRAFMATVGVDEQNVPGGALKASAHVQSGGDRLAIRDVDVAYAGLFAKFDADLSTSSVLEDSEIKYLIQGDSFSELLAVDDGLQFLDRAFRLSGSARLVPDTVQFQGLLFRTDEATLNADIEVGLKPAARTMHAQVILDVPDIYALAPKLADFTVLEEAPLKLRTTFAWDREILSISEFQSEIGKGKIDIRGSIERPPGFDRTDLDVDLHIEDLHNLSPLAGRELPHERVDFVVHLSGDGDTVTLQKFDGKIGASDVSGDFAWTAGEVSKVRLKLGSDYLDVTPFLPPVEPQLEPGTPGNPQANKSASKPGNARVLTDEPFSIGSLHGIDAAAEIRIKKMIVRQHILQNVVLDADIAAGVFNVREFDIDSPGSGRLRGRLGLDPGEDNIKFWIRAYGRNLKLGLPAMTASELDALPPYDFDLALITSGANPRQLASSANGYLKVSAGSGRIRAGAMRLFTQDFLYELLSTVNPFVKSDPYTELKCMVLLATAENGQIQGDPAFVAQSDRLNVFANAKINLADETLDADFNSVPMKGLGLSLSNLVNPYVKVAGTLAAPVLALDTESTLIQGGAAVATGGISILALGLKDRFFSDKDPCGTAIAKAESQFALLEEKYGGSSEIDKQ